jgi:hypothetical protein
MENQESSKHQMTLHRLSRQFIDLPPTTTISLTHHQRSPKTNIHTLSTPIASISFTPSANTRLPRLVYHLYVSSYHSGHTLNIPLIVSGAPLTAAIVFPPGNEETVDMRLRAEENWKRRRMVRTVRCAALALEGAIKSPTLKQI